MQYLLFQVLIALLLFAPKASNAQNLEQLMSAKEYHEMKTSPDKTKQIRELERKGWYQQDELMDHTGNFIKTKKFDLSPFVDSLGESVFLVSDISPEFPGGADSLNVYLQKDLGKLLAKSVEDIHNTLFVKFSVSKDGNIEAVEPAFPFPEWVPAATGQKCLASVQKMPKWSPAILKDQPVKLKMLMIFNLS